MSEIRTKLIYCLSNNKKYFKRRKAKYLDKSNTNNYLKSFVPPHQSK